MRKPSDAQVRLITAIANTVAAHGGRPIEMTDRRWRVWGTPSTRTLRACLTAGWLVRHDDPQPYRWDVTAEGYAAIGREPTDITA